MVSSFFSFISSFTCNVNTRNKFPRNEITTTTSYTFLNLPQMHDWIDQQQLARMFFSLFFLHFLVHASNRSLFLSRSLCFIPFHNKPKTTTKCERVRARELKTLFLWCMHKVHVSKLRMYEETRRDNVNIESVAQLNGAWMKEATVFPVYKSIMLHVYA